MRLGVAHIACILFGAVCVFAGCAKQVGTEHWGEDNTGGNAGIAVHKLMSGFAECAVDEDLEPETRTSIMWNTPGPDRHNVFWSVGDIVWSYSEAGLFMQDVITAPRLVDGGRGAQFEVAYHEGDKWVLCYCKGPKIKNFIGRRTFESLVLEDGIPHIQNGVFSDYHICIGQEVPEADTMKFWNVQSFIRFRVEGNELDAGGNPKGTVTGDKIRKIEIRNMTPEPMAGNMSINVQGRRYSVEYRNPLDSTVEVLPGSGHFEPGQDYYVAVPVRYYGKGMLFNLFNDSDVLVGYIKTPGSQVAYSSVLNIDDILKFLVFLCQRVQLKYAGEIVADNGSATEPAVTGHGIEILAGHSSTIESNVLPISATNRSLGWESDDSSVLTVSNDGTMTALKTGEALVTAKTLDGSGIEVGFKVTVKDNTGIGPGDYTETPFDNFL